jgi:UDP-N-acetyl-D-mannosaminuronic acid transferase (WecB/TagA/CpsF family)
MFFREFNILEEFLVANRFICDVDRLHEVIETNDFVIISYVNPHNINKIDFNKIFAVKNWYIVTDGYFVSMFLGKIFNKEIHPLNMDVSSSTLFRVLDISPPGHSVNFAGGTRCEANYFEEHFAYKNCVIKCFDGYDINSINRFLESDSAFKFLSLGSPLQENIVLKNFTKLKNTSKCIIMCGGFVGQFSSSRGKVYPNWVIKSNLRFIYRLFTEKSTFRRIVQTYIPFFIYAGIVLIIFNGKKKFKVDQA